jgi:hypothetical protein
VTIAAPVEDAQDLRAAQRLRRALWELAESSEVLRAAELAMDQGEPIEIGEEDLAVTPWDRYMAALGVARKLARSG